MKRYKLKITYFILSLLPFLASCTDENILQKSSVTEGVPTIVDISVGTAANTAKTRSALLESEERKIYDLYLWIFNSSGNKISVLPQEKRPCFFWRTINRMVTGCFM